MTEDEIFYFNLLKTKGRIYRDDLSGTRATQVKKLKELADRFDFLEYVEGNKSEQSKVLIKDLEKFNKYIKYIEDDIKEKNVDDEITKVLEGTPQKFIPFEAIQRMFNNKGITDFSKIRDFIFKFIATHPGYTEYKGGIATREYAESEDKFYYAKCVEEKIALTLFYEKRVLFSQVVKWYWPSEWSKYLDLGKKICEYYVGREWMLVRHKPELKGVKLAVDNNSLYVAGGNDE